MDGRERGNREHPGGSRQVLGSKAHRWLPGLQVDVAVITSMKTNKFRMHGERRGGVGEEAKVSKILAVLVSIATCLLTFTSVGPGLGRK